MSTKSPASRNDLFEKFSNRVTRAVGSTAAFMIAFGLVIIWSLTGPLFHYSEVWKMVITTATSVITFLMVFLIQKAQNKDSLAIQLKLNELVAANKLASNRLINVEGMTEDELRVIQKFYSRLSEFAQNEDSPTESHSIDESHKEHEIKEEMEKELRIFKKD